MGGRRQLSTSMGHLTGRRDSRITRTVTHVERKRLRKSALSANQPTTVIRFARSITGFSTRNTVNDSRQSLIGGRSTTQRWPMRTRSKKEQRKNWKNQKLREQRKQICRQMKIESDTDSAKQIIGFYMYVKERLTKITVLFPVKCYQKHSQFYKFDFISKEYSHCYVL